MQQQLQDGTHQLVFVGPLPDNDQEDDNDGDLTDFQSKIWFPFFGSLFSNALSQTIFNFRFLNLQFKKKNLIPGPVIVPVIGEAIM
jgi:hypothetical protein